MTDDGGRDRALDVAGAVLVLTLLAMVGVMALAFVDAPRGGTSAGPNVEWSAERIDETHVRIAHAGGEAVPADRLVVTVEGNRRRVTWSGSLSAGDSGVVRARADRELRLYWTSAQGERIRLESWRT